MTALIVRNLAAGYGGRLIVEDIAITVGGGEVVAVIGHNGAGKSTLLKAIFNLLPERSGEVEVSGRSLGDLPPHRLLTAGLAYVPQEHSTFAKLTVDENLRMGAYLIDDRTLYRRRLDAILASFPKLAERRGQLAGTLSGGEQRTLEIARTLLMEPKVIMLDEPTIGLAPKMVDLVFAAIATLRAQGRAVLVVEQNVRRALAAADRGYVMELGRIAFADRAATLIGDERVARLYMGRAKAS